MAFLRPSISGRVVNFEGQQLKLPERRTNTLGICLAAEQSLVVLENDSWIGMMVMNVYNAVLASSG